MDQNVGISRVLAQNGVQVFMPVLTIGRVHNESAACVQTIAVRTLRMMQREMANAEFSNRDRRKRSD